MNGLAKVGNTRLSAGYTRTVIGHKRAMAAPMLGCAMASDPRIHSRAKTGAEALRERRAVQYASAMGRRLGSLPGDQSALAAVWDEAKARVVFLTTGASQKIYAYFVIPEAIMTFDADHSMLLLSAPEESPAPCADTVNLFGEPETGPDDLFAMLAQMEDDFLIFKLVGILESA